MKSALKLRILLPIAAVACAFLPNLAEAQSYPPVWSNTGTYAAGDMVTDYGNIYRCIKTVSTHYLDPSKTYQNWELYYVRNNTTLVIGTGQSFPTLAVAWTFGQNCHIAEGVYLHLSISTANGNLNENLGSGINLDQPCGASISIIGDNQSNINFTSLQGIELDTGHSIGLISGITLTGSNQNTGSGVYLTTNASIGTLTESTVLNSWTPIRVDQGARLHCSSSVNVTGTQIAVYVEEGGSVVFDSDAVIQGAGAIGLEATLGGYISATYCTIEGCSNGVYATHGGIVDVHDTTFQQNTYGIQASSSSHVNADYAIFGTGPLADTGKDIGVYDAGTVNTFNATSYTSSLGTADGSFIFSNEP